jgi:hypothetical protein
MNKLLGWLGLTIGGWGGWILGERISLVAALLLSLVGTAAGLYVGRRLARDYF